MQVKTVPALVHEKMLTKKRASGRKASQNMTANKEVCRTCSKDDPKLAMLMIACDKCLQWYHYVCVGVNEEEAEEVVFVCPTGCSPESL